MSVFNIRQSKPKHDFKDSSFELYLQTTFDNKNIINLRFQVKQFHIINKSKNTITNELQVNDNEYKNSNTFNVRQ